MNEPEGRASQKTGADAVVEEPVDLPSDDLRLRAVLVRPRAQVGPAPAVAFSHGWSGAVNERVLPLARLLSEAGYVTLALDHRGFGGSEGVRARCDPAEQVRDLSNALTFLGSLDQVDADALGLVGVSFGGAIAVAAGAADGRARATVSIVGIGDAGRWLRALRPADVWSDLEKRLEEDRSGPPGPGQGARVDFSVLMPLPPNEGVTAELANMQAKYPEGYPLENLGLADGFRPEEEIGRISPRAVCLITCADDSVVSPEESDAMFRRAGEPKELHVFPEGNHGGPLGPLVEETARVTKAFLDRHLLTPR